MNNNMEAMQQPTWYTNAQTYWTSVSPTVDGSLEFIEEFVHSEAPVLNNGYACDCGAGIGRVTKNFLLKVPFQKVDLVEQEAGFVQQAKDDYLKQEIDEGRVGYLYAMGLQDFVPEKNKYDLIWCQWVLGHLNDEDLVAFFKRCIEGLKPNGLIAVKENSASKEYMIDEEDSSVTRPNHALKKIFEKAGLVVVKEDTQKGMPAGLFVVRMYMLKPADRT
ncbi:alpha-N-methyltransferase NTM1 [Spinellus fusiger]|nr:alpha-N-methyltransferase NTM1 [Spinellus fusiger]